MCSFRGGGDRSPPNTMWPGPRPTCMPSFILIRPTVWPQYTNVTDRQTNRTDRQRTDSIGRTVLQTVAQKWFALSYRTVVCLSVCNVVVLWPNGWMDQDKTLHAGRPRPWPHCVRWGPSSPSPRERGTAGCSPLFLAHLYCGNGRPSQLLLSSCCILVIYTVSQKTSHIWLAITLTQMHRF